jgi:hypothetical protein
MNSTAGRAVIILMRSRPCRKKAKSAARNAAVMNFRNFTGRRIWAANFPIPEREPVTRAAEGAVRVAAAGADPDYLNGSRTRMEKPDLHG